MPTCLPACVGHVLLRIERVEAALLQPFPDLESAPPTDDAARKRARAAMAWAQGIDAALRGKLPRPPHGDAGESLWDLFRVSSGSGITHPRDILGEPPFLEAGCNAGVLLHAFPGGPLSSRRIDLASWPSIRDDILKGYTSLNLQVWVLIGWVRDRVVALNEAASPRISVKLEERVAVVAQAGRQRRVSLTRTNLGILEHFALDGTSGVVRRNAVRGGLATALLRRLPELAPHVVAQHLPRGADITNAGCYALSETVRKRLSIER